MEKIKKSYWIWGIVVVSLFILLTLFGFLYKKKANVYKELENKLIEAEKKYVDAKFLYPTTNEPVKITAKEMIENGFMNHLNLEEETCDGYAVVIKNGTVFEYKGYVNCKNYKTKGY